MVKWTPDNDFLGSAMRFEGLRYAAKILGPRQRSKEAAIEDLRCAATSNGIQKPYFAEIGYEGQAF